MISVLIITYGRKQELFQTLECISKYNGSSKIELLILDNNSDNILKQPILDIFRNRNNLSVSYFHDGYNYGVANGRNYLIEKAQGDILITLDDDIEFDSIDIMLDKVSGYFSDNPNIGALAFNIKNFYSRKALRHEIPHGNKKLNFTINLMTYYFIGAGHAIRKDVYDKCGVYPVDLGLYGGEERDLSFRILEHNYDILYASDIIIYHKVSPDGRLPREKENFYRYRNQLIVLNRYMPFLYRVTANFIWSVFYLIRKNGKLREVYDTLVYTKNMPKKTLPMSIIRRIEKMNGRVYY